MNGVTEVFSNVNQTLAYFETYGLWFLFIIVFLEYLNLPGLPAGIIMPAIGALVAHSKYDFLLVFCISIIAATLGSVCLYYFGYFIGNAAMTWIYKKFPKSRKSIDKVSMYCEKFGAKGIFICRLVPVARTIVSLTSGTIREKISTFVIYSIPGIAIWNFVFIISGYLASKAMISI